MRRGNSVRRPISIRLLPLPSPSIEVVTKSVGDGEVEYVHRIRLAPKVDALKTLAQHLGLLRMKVDVDAADALPIRIVHQHLKE
jgi:hypothetical protein